MNTIELDILSDCSCAVIEFVVVLEGLSDPFISGPKGGLKSNPRGTRFGYIQGLTYIYDL